MRIFDWRCSKHCGKSGTISFGSNGLHRMKRHRSVGFRRIRSLIILMLDKDFWQLRFNVECKSNNPAWFWFRRHPATAKGFLGRWWCGRLWRRTTNGRDISASSGNRDGIQMIAAQKRLDITDRLATRNHSHCGRHQLEAFLQRRIGGDVSRLRKGTTTGERPKPSSYSSLRKRDTWQWKWYLPS